MLKVNNGRLETKHVSFALPEGFTLHEPDLLVMGCFVFVSDDKATQIEIAFDRAYGTEEEEMEELCADGEFVRAGEFFRVKRGEKEATAMYYCNSNGDEEYYEEVYHFDEENEKNQFSVFIMHRRKQLAQSELAEVMEQPAIKNFFNSIEYR